jgi:hypothetical protein
LCTGCMLIVPNTRTVIFAKTIYENRRRDLNDQFVVEQYLKLHEMKVHTFPQVEFPNGLMYFIDPNTITNPVFREAREQFKAYTGSVLFVHANWMVGGDTKIRALKSKGLWYV